MRSGRHPPRVLRSYPGPSFPIAPAAHTQRDQPPACNCAIAAQMSPPRTRAPAFVLHAVTTATVLHRFGLRLALQALSQLQEGPCHRGCPSRSHMGG